MPVLRTPLAVALVSLVVVPACGAIEDDPPTSTAAQALSCGEPFCGNTPFLGPFPVFELDQTGTTFSKIEGVPGLRIGSFVDKNGKQLRPAVSGFTLYGVRPDKTKVSGAALDGAKLTIETDTIPMKKFELTIEIAAPVPFYENGDDGTKVPTYRITYVDPAFPQGHRHLCSGSTDKPNESLVYAGDRYDAYTGDVIATGAAAGPWFNIACKDDARWKLALMRYVEAAQDATHKTSAEEREAGLRSIRADYCGNGVAMTEIGIDIDWDSTGGWLTVDAANEPVEAIWTDDGAICVSNPRYVALDTIPCAKKCGDLWQTWSAHGSWITYLP